MTHEVGNIELTDEKVDAIVALNKIKELKDEVPDDRQLAIYIEGAEERLEDIIKEDEPEDLDSFIRRLYRQNKSRDYIVEQVRVLYGFGDDAEDMVDTWAQYEGVDLYPKGYSKGGTVSKKYTLAELFGVSRKFFTGGKSDDKPSVFKTALKKSGATAKTEKADKHTTVIIPGIGEKLERITELRNKISEIEAESKMLEGEVRGIGRTEFLKLYEEKKKNPDTFIIRGDKGGCMMIIPMDRYLSITKERAAQIADSFGDELIEEESTFSFNNDLLQKYEPVLDALIKGSKDITEEDKDNLIEAKTVYKIKKGSIDRLYELFRTKLSDVFYAIEPVFQLKNCK